VFWKVKHNFYNMTLRCECFHRACNLFNYVNYRGIATSMALTYRIAFSHDSARYKHTQQYIFKLKCNIATCPFVYRTYINSLKSSKTHYFAKIYINGKYKNAHMYVQNTMNKLNGFNWLLELILYTLFIFNSVYAKQCAIMHLESLSEL